ncbi:MAG: serine/threonine protein kinase [Myxococcales bacterium]|nr:serine/threonine protein kinase [Myxococcales bacterium]
MTTRELTRSPADLAAGMAVGEFVIEKKIGEGGFGSVYKATHPLIGKLVAIKVLAHHFSVQEEMVSRFIAEARAVNQIRNRNIIDIFSFGTLPDGRVYYVMEFLDGESLEAYATRVGPLPLAEVIAIVGPIARALDAAHAVGIAHRDIKPENILLVRDEGQVFPKLLDFGIAKLLGNDAAMHKTQTGAPIGTPDYMSPEQCRGRDVDHRTDFYSFGVMLYRLLTGRVPFDGEDYLAILMKHISDPVPPLRAVRPDLAGTPEEVIGWLLQKQAADRPPSLRVAMEQLKGSRITEAMPRAATSQLAHGATMASGAPFSPALGTLPARASRRSLWLALAGGAVLVAGAVAAWMLMSESTAPPDELQPDAAAAASAPPQVAADASLADAAPPPVAAIPPVPVKPAAAAVPEPSVTVPATAGAPLTEVPEDGKSSSRGTAVKKPKPRGSAAATLEEKPATSKPTLNSTEDPF